MRTTIRQWGNSLALRIPKAMAEQTGLKKGSLVRLTVEKNQIVITPFAKKGISLKSLLARITPENIHPETDWGPPVGEEFW